MSGVIKRKPIPGPAAWYGRTLADSDEWIYRVSDADITEIEAAVAGIRHRGLAMTEMTKDAFRLPRLATVAVPGRTRLHRRATSGATKVMYTAEYTAGLHTDVSLLPTLL